jgi:endoglucanase
MQVIVDLHNYARRIVDGEKYLIGTEQLTTSHFSNFWSRLSAALRQYENIYGYGLMNEPHDIDNHAVSWFMMAQEAILAIRQQDMAHSVIVGGDSWSSAERWLEYSDNLRLLYDPARMLMFEAHVYFDRDASGTYRESYDDSGCTVETGVKRVRPFVEWLKQNQLNGFVGEYGVPDNDERWLETLDRFLEYLQANGVNATYWAGGNRWGNYKLRISPTKGLDRPQMKIVEKYLYAHQ